MNGAQATLTVEAPDLAAGKVSDRRLAVATRIEVAALEKALEQGIEILTVEEVALAAGVSRRTFYRYFPTIEHALCALLQRSVDRLADNLLTRPPSENIFTALVQAARMVSPSREDLVIQQLCHEVAQRSPGAWMRVVNNAGVSASEGMEPVIAARMALAGEDPSRAGLVIAIYLNVVAVLGRSNRERGKYAPDPDLLHRSLCDLTEFMHRSLCE